MHFNMKRPCQDCPFRRDIDGFLTAGRAAEIAAGMLRDNTTFQCHKTLNWYSSSDEDEDENEDEDGQGRCQSTQESEQSEHCAGALIFSLKHENKARFANGMLQIAERFGLYEPSKVDRDAFPQVFDSAEEMIDHHAESCGYKRHRPEGASDT